ncbi:hypothetical protein MASR1M46_06940 [Bacteroidales bacterium]
MLGISMQEIDGDLAKEKGLEGTNGIYIAEVVRDGAADRSGIKEGDVLLSINGVQVNSGPAVQEQISKYRPKDKINIELLRNGKQISLSVVLQSKSDDNSTSDISTNGVIKLFGAELKEAPKELLEKLSLKNGVVVLSVSEGKFKSTGIKKGFVITYVNQTPVSNAAELSSIIKRSRRSVLIEGVYPDGSVFYYGMGL